MAFIDRKNWKSGEMLTSLGNTLLNQLIIEFTAEMCYLDPDQYDYICEGDDGVVASDDPEFL